MKTIKTKIAIFLLAFMIILSVDAQKSYNQGTAVNYGATITAGTQYFIIQHDVSDFAIWKKAYDADLERRNQAGLKEMLILKGVENPNSITIIFEFKDIKVVTGMMNDPALAETMKKAGVISKPVFTTFNVLNSSAAQGNAYVLVKHKVADFDKWKKAFDGHEKVRKDFKLSLVAVGNEIDDSNSAVVLLCTDKAENIASFLKDSDIKAVMEKGGVVGEPNISIMTQTK